jgi:hypothetical protein
MAERRRALSGLKWLSLVLALVAACAGAQKKAEPPPPPAPPTELVAWLPADSNVVARVTLEPFRSTPLWSLWTDLSRSEQPFTGFIDLALVDEIMLGGRLEEAADGAPSITAQQPLARHKPHFVAAVRGRFGAGYLAGLAASNQLAVQQRGPIALVARPDEVWSQISPDLLIAFSPDLTEQVVARASAGPGAPVRDGVLYKTLAARVGFDGADLALLAEDTSGAGKEALRTQSSRLANLAEDVQRAGLSVDMGTDVLVRAIAETPDATRAQGLHQSVAQTLESLGRNLFVGILGLRPVVTALKPSSEANFVKVDGSIASADLTPVLNRLSSMLQLAAQADGAPPAP